jgi:hypothetical protein
MNHLPPSLDTWVTSLLQLTLTVSSSAFAQPGSFVAPGVLVGSD